MAIFLCFLVQKYCSVRTKKLHSIKVKKVLEKFGKYFILGYNRMIIECVLERRTSMFLVLDTNLWTAQCSVIKKGEMSHQSRDIFRVS